MPSLYDELELVQSRSSADDDGPQLLDDNVTPTLISLKTMTKTLISLKTMTKKMKLLKIHTLVELMEPPTKEEVDDSEGNLPKTRPLSFTLLFAPPVRKGKPR
jgi:hypothetical protein